MEFRVLEVHPMETLSVHSVTRGRPGQCGGDEMVSSDVIHELFVVNGLKRENKEVLDLATSRPRVARFQSHSDASNAETHVRFQTFNLRISDHVSPRAQISPSRLVSSRCFEASGGVAASGASAAFLPSLPAVSVPVGVDVDRVFLPLSLPLRTVLALLLGPQDHAGESHEHLSAETHTTTEVITGRRLPPLQQLAVGVASPPPRLCSLWRWSQTLGPPPTPQNAQHPESPPVYGTGRRSCFPLREEKQEEEFFILAFSSRSTQGRNGDRFEALRC